LVTDVYDAGAEGSVKIGIAVFIIGALVVGAFAQSNAGSGRWEVLTAWGQLPAGSTWGAASQVSTTPEGQIVVFRRMVPSFFVFNPDGSFVKSWGDVPYRLAHGIRIDKDGFIWVTDNTDNFIQKFSPDGKLLMTVGRKGMAGDNASQDAFDGPADVFVAPNGDFYVADGYRNSRVVQFSKEGKFIRIIGGTKGSEPGQFNLPHSVVLDSKGRLIVADAENNRIQVFDSSGKFLEQWTDFIAKPRGSLYITADDTLYVSHVDAEAISVMKNGKVVDIIRGVGGRPHGMTLDREGNIYVSFPLTQGVKKIAKK
jgi:DNA-binding beta-propeller fold protein YncE